MKRTFLSAFLCVLGVSAVAALPEGSSPGIVVHEGLVFSEPDEALRMDLFLPPPSPKPVSCVMVIQGGGFLAQDGKKFRPFAEYLAGNGFAAALIAYRGRPRHTCLDSIADVKAAVRFVRRRSGQYNINPGRIGAMGRSAGGTLAALLAATGGMEEFEGRGGHPEFSSRIQAAVAYAGIFDFVARFTDQRQLALQPKGDAKKETNREWIGEDFSPESPRWRAASATNHVDASDPPMLLVHCKDDATVPWIQSENMAHQMKEAGVLVETEYYETGGHGFATPDRNAPMARMLAFFQKTLAE
jgi:acetyl esterase/lipase